MFDGRPSAPRQGQARTNMTPSEWLEQYAPGFANLSSEERFTIYHFSILWSLLEASALGTNANVTMIENLVNKWKNDKLPDITAFEPALVYFRERYHKDGAQAPDYQDLFRPNENHARGLVTEGLKTGQQDVFAKLVALIIICYRLRNNLFHGIKWAYELRGQLYNFDNANSIIMGVLGIIGFDWTIDEQSGD